MSVLLLLLLLLRIHPGLHHSIARRSSPNERRTLTESTVVVVVALRRWRVISARVQPFRFRRSIGVQRLTNSELRIRVDRMLLMIHDGFPVRRVMIVLLLLLFRPRLIVMHRCDRRMLLMFRRRTH